MEGAEGVFCIGDLVFAKVRGYPPWPGKIIGFESKSSKETKYNILFFGKFERAMCKESNVFHFEEHKDKYGKCQSKGFQESFEQIEEEAREHASHMARVRETIEANPSNIVKTEKCCLIPFEGKILSSPRSESEALDIRISTEEPNFVLKEEPIDSEETWRDTIKQELESTGTRPEESEEVDYHEQNLKRDVPSIQITGVFSLKSEEHISTEEPNFVLKEEPMYSEETWQDTIKQELESTDTRPEESEEVDYHEQNLKVAAVFPILEETSYLQDKKYNSSPFPQGGICEPEQHPHPNGIHPGEVDSFQNIDLEKPGPSSAADRPTESPNARSSPTIQEFIHPGCEKASLSLLDLMEHKKSHDNRSFKCNICDKGFLTKSSLEKHMGIHAVAAVYEGTRLPKKSTIKNTSEGMHALGSRKLISKKIETFTCEFCKETFTYKNTLVRHLSIHGVEKPYKCDLCSSGFNRKHSLKVHFRTHTGEKPFSCPVCQKKFSSKYNLSCHSQVHTGKMRFKCNICSKQFSQKMLLNSHSCIHTGETPFVCSVCGKGFNLKANLKVHTMIHTGERPFECKVCSRKFTQFSSLKSHIRIHSGEKPFECKVCSKKFSHSSTLKDHIRIHSGEKPFECKVCSKKFTQRSSFKRHSRIHRDE